MATAIASSGVRSALARPRTPSVPKSRPIAKPPKVGPTARSNRHIGRRTARATRNGRAPTSRGAPGRHASLALRVLRSLTGLLQTVLLALGRAGVPGQEAGLLEGGTVVRVV